MIEPGLAGRSPAFDAAGWLPGARQICSPNFDERPAQEAIRLIVIHAISLPAGSFGGDAVARLFTNQLDPQAHPAFRDVVGMKVSAHFFVRRDGELIQFVPVTMRAWHAGVSCWRGHERCNDFSIGIELEGDDRQPFAAPQYACLERLLALLAQAFPVEAIVGHCDIAPGRKSDPGPCFEWRQLPLVSAMGAS